MVSQTEKRVCLSLEHQNRQVNVTLEFPEHSDQRAEQEFMDRLKAIYLKKFEVWEGQKEALSLPFPAARDGEEEDID